MHHTITPVAALMLALAAPLAAASSLVLAPALDAVSMQPKGDKGKPDKQEKGDKDEKGEKSEKGGKGKDRDAGEEGDDDSDDAGKSKGQGKKAENTPHLGRALKELRLARNHLDNAKHDFGGHKANALKAIDDAMAQIQLAMKYDPQSSGEAPAPNADGTPTGTPAGTAPNEPSDEKSDKGKEKDKGKGKDGDKDKGKKKDK